MSDIELDFSSPDTERSEQLISESGTLTIPINDEDLVALIDAKTTEASEYLRSKSVDDRRKRNEKFWRGDQVDEGKLENHEQAYVDNLIYRNLETRIAIASSKIPDFIVRSPNDTLKSRENARSIEQLLNIKIKNDDSRRLIKHGLRHNHLYFQGAIKAFWDENMGEHGDFGFRLVRPHRILVDPNAVIGEQGYTADEMEFIIEWIEEPLAVVLNKFPKKRLEILGVSKKGQKTKDMASKIRYQEIWFSFYNKEARLVEGVAWKFQNIILDKQNNPYHDLEGSEKVLSQPRIERDEVVTTEQFFRNFFDRPRKPYIFFSYVSLGDGPIDATSPVEQSISLQNIVNRRGMQITEIADVAIPRLIFSGRYIEKSEVARLSSDPKEYIHLKNAENVREAVTQIVGQPPNPILFQDLIENRNQIDSQFATHGTTRGEVRAESSGISKQVSREGDLTISDDISVTVVNRVMREMAGWALQLIKLNYKQPHFVRELGTDGQVVSSEIQRDMIEDGLIVSIDANSVDKDARRSDALQMANAQLIDPFTLFEEMSVENPKQRARRVMAFKLGEVDQFQSYKDMLDLEGDEGGAESAQRDIQSIQQSGQIPQPQRVDEEYLQTFFQFVNSPAFDQQPEPTKIAIQQFIGGLRQMADRVGIGREEAGVNPVQQ